MLFNLIFFILLGAVFPWQDFKALGVGRLLFISITILLFRRLPVVMLLKPFIGQLRTGREAFFAGWFGPMGVGAIFFAMVCRHHTGIPQETASAIFTIVSFVVLSSIVIHGITVPITHFHLKNRARRKAARKKGFFSENSVPVVGAVSTPIGTSGTLDLQNGVSSHSVDEKNSSENSAIVDIHPPILRDIPEPRLVDQDIEGEGDDDINHRRERNLIYGANQSNMASPDISSMLPLGGGRRKVADISSAFAHPSELSTTTETEDMGLTTEDDSNVHSHRRHIKKEPYRMRPVTTTDFEDESQYDDYDDVNGGNRNRTALYDENSINSGQESTSTETFDGRNLRQEQILARMKTHSFKPVSQH